VLSVMKKVVFLLAHPDDELLMSGFIRCLVKHSIPVYLAWLTSGDLFGKQEQRERELSLAADTLGIDPDNRRLFRLPDMGLVKNLNKLVAIVKVLCIELGPTHVFVPAYEEGHPDHDALNFAAHSVWKSLNSFFCLIEFPLYNGTGPFFFLWLRVNAFPPGRQDLERHVLDFEQIALKTRLINIYASQPRSMLPIKLTHSYRRLCSTCVEPYAYVPEDRDYQLRPHSGSLFYERPFNKHLNMTHEQFAHTVANFERK